jgi:hypothetical protein
LESLRRSPRLRRVGVGGINPWRLGGALPRRWFARKISKFKRKSPLRKNVENLSFDRDFEGCPAMKMGHGVRSRGRGIKNSECFAAGPRGYLAQISAKFRKLFLSDHVHGFDPKGSTPRHHGKARRLVCTTPPLRCHATTLTCKQKYEQSVGSVIGPIQTDSYPTAFKALFLETQKAWRSAVSSLQETGQRYTRGDVS